MSELIVVLDVNTRDEALAIVDACAPCHWFKVGSQLFTRCGPEIVRELHKRQKSVMLDLKFHDIPNTVHESAAAAADLGVAMFTLHAAGGKAMIERAREAVSHTETRILAVTVLTSFTPEALREEVGLRESPAEAVPRYAALAMDGGAHGIVCSPREIALVREATPKDTLIVTPGIRPEWSEKNDQARASTPADAVRAGATHLVVGRPILSHPDPREAVSAILKEVRLAETGAA